MKRNCDTDIDIQDAHMVNERTVEIARPDLVSNVFITSHCHMLSQ
jgi:hypothetical protein